MFVFFLTENAKSQQYHNLFKVNVPFNLWWRQADLACVRMWGRTASTLAANELSHAAITIETGRDNDTGPDGRMETLTTTGPHTTRVLSPSALYCCPADTSTRLVKTYTVCTTSVAEEQLFNEALSTGCPCRWVCVGSDALGSRPGVVQREWPQ